MPFKYDSHVNSIIDTYASISHICYYIINLTWKHTKIEITTNLTLTSIYAPSMSPPMCQQPIPRYPSLVFVCSSFLKFRIVNLCNLTSQLRQNNKHTLKYICRLLNITAFSVIFWFPVRQLLALTKYISSSLFWRLYFGCGTEIDKRKAD